MLTISLFAMILAQADTRVCGYRPGAARMIEVPARTEYGPNGIEGAALVGGRTVPWKQAGYAEGARGKPWSIANEPLQLLGTVYVKYGLPRVLSVSEVEWIANKEGVPIFSEVGSAEREVLYVLHNPFECSFQPYERKHGAPAPTAAPAQPSPQRQELNRRLLCQGLAISLGIKFGLPANPSPARLQAFKDAEAIVRQPIWGEVWPKGTQTMFAATIPDKAEQMRVRGRITKYFETIPEAKRIADFNICLAKYPRA